MADTADNMAILQARKRLPGRPLSPEERVAAQDVFLAHYKDTANVRRSCEKANIGRSTFYDWLKHDAEFKALYDDAEPDAADYLLDEAWTRATKGYLKPVISNGKVVYDDDGNVMMERVVSDMMLKALMVWRIKGFGKAQLEVTGKDGTPLQVHVYVPEPEIADATHDMLTQDAASFVLPPVEGGEE